MQANFDDWNILKKDLHNKNRKILFKEWDIWWVSLGQNIATESYGKGEFFRRPVLVLKKLSSTDFIAIPLSTKIKTWTWFYTYTMRGEKYTALLSQVRMLHSNRMQRREWRLDDADFLAIKNKFKELLNL